MADSEIAGLTEDTTPDPTDNIYAQDAAGNVDKRVPLSALATLYQPLSPVLTATTASFTTADESKLDGIEAGAEVNDTAAEILTKLLTVDGAGSGLDADLLDGQSSAAFETPAGAQSKADAKVAQTITDGVTTSAPSQDAVFDALALKADLASPALTGNPTAPTATQGDSDTSIATTAFVNAEILADAYTPGGADVAVADGGTGASTASAARTNLGLGTMAVETATDYVTKALYDANSVLIATSDNTPLALTVAASRVVGRKASGDIDDMTGAETAAVLAGEVFKQAQEVNAQTGTTYTLVAGDAGKLVTLSNASPVTLTVPQDSDATIAVGTYVDLYALGAGQVTVSAGSGATLRVSGLTAKSRAQYARLGLQKVSANTWSLFGDLAAA